MHCLSGFQGPCAGNQLALAHSRLWDAVGGFLYIFAHMQDKLSKVRPGGSLKRFFKNLMSCFVAKEETRSQNIGFVAFSLLGFNVVLTFKTFFPKR